MWLIHRQINGVKHYFLGFKDNTDPIWDEDQALIVQPGLDQVLFLKQICRDVYKFVGPNFEVSTLIETRGDIMIILHEWFGEFQMSPPKHVLEGVAGTPRSLTNVN